MNITKSQAIVGFTVFGLGLVLGFQNCSNQARFNSAPEEISSSVSSQPVDADGHSIICDPFSVGSKCSAEAGGPGLMGNIYYLTSDVYSADLRSALLADYFKFGVKVDNRIILSELNIPRRDFSAGFPAGVDTDGRTIYVKDSKGNTLIEYFALKLEGNILVDAAAEGSYQFALVSDDGSSLSIDGIKVIDNDGIHSMMRSESKSLVELNRSIKYPINVNYFQGPRVEIGLLMYWRKCLEFSSRTSCSKFADWSIVPKAVLSH